MGKVTFILNTSAETLAAWLLANWRTPHGASEEGTLQGQSLQRSYRPNQTNGAIILGADVIWVSKPNEEGVQEAYPFRDAFLFVLQPLAAERVEVTAECRFHYTLLADLARLLEDMARRWPELRDTLEYLPDYWDFDSPPPTENETQQKLLDAFDARLRRLKGEPAQPLALQGKNATGAIFYLDGATAHEVTTWLTENWRRRNREPANVWTWPTDYHHGRRYQTTPIQETADDAGRALLTVGMVEWETNHPDPLSVPFGPLVIPQDQFALVQDNPRALEILVIQAGSDLVQVEARCNALLLLHSFTDLLRDAKKAYRDRLRMFAPTFGIMDAGPHRTHAMMDTYFKARAEEFHDLVIAIEPKFSPLLGGPARDDGAAPASEPGIDGPARADGHHGTRDFNGFGAGGAARADSPDPDSIPQWGTRRDLSTHEVREIVKRCKEFQQLPGGSIARFHDQESRKWPEPDDAPKGYSLKTLQKWVTDERFQ